MDYTVIAKFRDRPSITVELRDVCYVYGSDVIREALRKLGSEQCKDVIGVNILYIGEPIEHKEN